MKVKIFTVGGTIDKVYFDKKSHYEVGNPTVKGILDEANVTVKLEIESLLHKDSLDMNKEDRETVAKAIRKEENKAILVTHGTDTMVKTAMCVKKTIKGSNKTVVFTGSMTPAIFKSSDAEFNIGGALIACQILPPGVYIVINGKIFDPEHTVKNVVKGCFEKMK
jgi:L-asparaginase